MHGLHFFVICCVVTSHFVARMGGKIFTCSCVGGYVALFYFEIIYSSLRLSEYSASTWFAVCMKHESMLWAPDSEESLKTRFYISLTAIA